MGEIEIKANSASSWAGSLGWDWQKKIFVALGELSNIWTVYFSLFLSQFYDCILDWQIMFSWIYGYANNKLRDVKQSLFPSRIVSLSFGNHSNHRDLLSQSSEVLSMSLSKNAYACTRLRVYHFVPTCILSLYKMALIDPIFEKMKDDSVLNGIMRYLTFLGSFWSSTLPRNIAPSI